MLVSPGSFFYIYVDDLLMFVITYLVVFVDKIVNNFVFGRTALFVFVDKVVNIFVNDLLIIVDTFVVFVDKFVDISVDRILFYVHNIVVRLY